MDEAYDEETDLAFQPGRLSWLTPMILGIQVVEEMGTAVVDGLAEMKMALVAHSTYKLQRELVAAQAGAELEQILEEGSDGATRGLSSPE